MVISPYLEVMQSISLSLSLYLSPWTPWSSQAEGSQVAQPKGNVSITDIFTTCLHPLTTKKPGFWGSCFHTLSPSLSPLPSWRVQPGMGPAPPGTAPKRSRAPPCLANLGRGMGLNSLEKPRENHGTIHENYGEAVENHAELREIDM